MKVELVSLMISEVMKGSIRFTRKWKPLLINVLLCSFIFWLLDRFLFDYQFHFRYLHDNGSLTEHENSHEARSLKNDTRLTGKEKTPQTWGKLSRNVKMRQSSKHEKRRGSGLETLKISRDWRNDYSIKPLPFFRGWNAPRWRTDGCRKNSSNLGDNC